MTLSTTQRAAALASGLRSLMAEVRTLRLAGVVIGSSTTSLEAALNVYAAECAALQPVGRGYVGQGLDAVAAAIVRLEAAIAWLGSVALVPTLEADLLDHAAAAALLSYDGADLASRFNTAGDTTGNALWAAGPCVFTGSISGTTLTVTSVTSGQLLATQFITAAGVDPLTKITRAGSGGGVGTYPINISQSVATRTMQAGLGEYLDIESPRVVYEVAASALIAGNAGRLETAVTALERGYDVALAGVLGDYPLERGGPTVSTNRYHDVHPKSEWGFASAKTLLMFDQSDSVLLTAPIRARLDALKPKVLKFARWMAASDDAALFFTDKRNQNQLWFVAAFLRGAAVLCGDEDLAAAAEVWIADLIPRQGSDGTFYEKGGFDPAYQTVSFDCVCFIAGTFAVPSTRPDLIDCLRAGVLRWTGMVGVDGTFTELGTRTGFDADPIPGAGPKGADVDVFPIRLYKANILLAISGLDALADTIRAKGQSLGHI